MATNDDLDHLDPQDLDIEEEELEAEDEDESALLVQGEDEAEAGDSNLEEILAPRPAPRRGRDEPEEEEDIISALVPDSDFVASESLPSTVVPIKDRQEFVCSNCHLVKARSQLADPARELCRDCV